jgi:16S rRNA (uracil1498-N3)-methyltransferase
MSLPFFFQPDLSVQPDVFILNEDTSKHIIQVLRMKNGEMLQLTDGAGLNVSAEIIDDHKKKCTVRKTNVQTTPPPLKKISVAISPIKNTSRFEWFLEKATEIGVTEIIPIICYRTEKQHFRHDRMNNILISAMLQSRQSYLPRLQEPTPFSSIITSKEYQLKLIAHCNEDAGKQTFHTIDYKSSVLILIGPEGDFTNEEVALATSNNFLPVSLGKNRLRTETAGVVATALLAHLMQQ